MPARVRSHEAPQEDEYQGTVRDQLAQAHRVPLGRQHLPDLPTRKDGGRIAETARDLKQKYGALVSLGSPRGAPAAWRPSSLLTITMKTPVSTRFRAREKTATVTMPGFTP